MAVTIHDVAEKAGVSVATVSRAVNGLPGLSDETRSRVLEVINALGYVPRGRRAKRRFESATRTVALITPRDASAMEGIPVYTRGIAAMRAAARALDCRLVFLSDDGGLVGAGDLAGSCDGAVFYACRRTTNDWVDLAESGFPFVLANVRVDDGRIPWVAVDERWGARLVVQRLLEAGRQRIGYVYFNAPGLSHPGTPDYERLNAVTDVMNQFSGSKVAFEKLCIRGSKESTPAIERFVSTFNPDALIVYNELLCMLVYVALSQRGVKIPKDCAVITFDDTELSLTVSPTLSRIHTPVDVVCETAFRYLNHLLDQPAHDQPTLDRPGAAVQHTLIAPWFVRGQSCGT